MGHCGDVRRLSECLSTLAELRAEWQQRSWSLHEDAETICLLAANLSNLLVLHCMSFCNL